MGGLRNDVAIAETIENNVRRKIIHEQLTDPAYYDKMSTLLDEIIAARKARAIEYEEYLKRIADLARRVEAGSEDDAPRELRDRPAVRALYNNLKDGAAPRVSEPKAVLDLALKVDEAVRKARFDAWRGVQARELMIKRALFGVLHDEAEVERIFLIVKAQREY